MPRSLRHAWVIVERFTTTWYHGHMAKKNTSIALGERWMDCTRAQVESGEFDSTSEVIRDALRLHEERAAFKSKLLEAIDEGLASPLVEFDIDRWYEEEFGQK